MNLTELLITGCTIGTTAIPAGPQMFQSTTAEVYRIPEPRAAVSLVMAYVNGEFRLVSERELEDLEDAADAAKAASEQHTSYDAFRRELGLR